MPNQVYLRHYPRYIRAGRPSASGLHCEAGGPGPIASGKTFYLMPVFDKSTLIATAPEGLDFYRPPSPLPGKNGDVLFCKCQINNLACAGALFGLNLPRLKA